MPRSGSPWADTPELDSGSGAEEYDEDELDEREWGLEKGMELFEVSAKDDMGQSVSLLHLEVRILKCLLGITQLFDALILAIIAKKDVIEQENGRHDSIRLTLTTTPTWAAQADEEEAREKEAARSHAARSCCQT